MSVLLLANVGNSDLHLVDRELLPEREDPHWWTSRRLGEEVCDHFDHYSDTLELPLIGPTVQWIFEQDTITGNELNIVLFASDQQKGLPHESEWLKDTAPVAEAIQLRLAHKPFEIPKKNIRILRIEGSPADYANMLRFYAEKLPQIANSTAPNTHIYMEVSGGTPAMTSMLIVMGVEVFGEFLRTLYVDRGTPMPYELGVARELFARKMRATLRDQINLYAYAVAQKTLEQAGSLITPDDHQRQLLDALLIYADRRLAFDFARARKVLQQRAHGLATGVPQAQIKHWLHELDSPDAADQLAELLHSAVIKLKFGDYADFVQRVFRFQEATFRYMAVCMGIEYGKSEQYLSQSWLKTQPDLQNYLTHYPRGADGKPCQQPISIDTGRSLNRVSLGAIVDYYVQHETRWKSWNPAAEALFNLSAVADLRNRGISGHGLEGIGVQDLEAAFGGTIDDLVMSENKIYEILFGHPPGENPYDAINTLILDLMQGA